jgi:1-acyl-sn-glycerol-3-phosphate acyltransferase
MKSEWIPFLKHDNADPDDLIQPNKLKWLYLRVLWIAPYRAIVAISLLVLPFLGSFLKDSKSLQMICIKVCELLCQFGLNLKITQHGFPDLSASTIVSNHVAMWDGFVLFACKIPSVYVSSSYVADMPLIGRAAKKLGFIFVNRESTESREQTTEAIADFQKNYRVDGSGQLVIFPEMTTTNQKYLCKFRLGAFRSLLPVQPVRIEYEDRNIAFVSSFSVMSLVALSFVLNGGEVKVTWLPVMTPCLGESCEVYAERVRDAIAGVVQSGSLKKNRNSGAAVSPSVLEKFDNNSHKDHIELAKTIEYNI